MTFEELQALARRVHEVRHRFQPWSDAVDVLADALIEEGHVAANGMTKGEIRSAAALWADQYAFRRTGRTTRILQQALEQAANGARVCVLAANVNHANQITSHLARLTNDLDALGRIDVQSIDRDGPIPRGRPFDLVVEDHYTTERRQGWR